LAGSATLTFDPASPSETGLMIPGGKRMRRLLFVLAFTAGAAAHGQEAATPPPAGQPAAPGVEGGFANEGEKGSYAVGYNFGQMLRSRKIELVTEQLLAGLRDAVTGGQARMSEEDAIVMARQIQNEAMRRLQKEKAELALKNREEGTAFLEANKKRPGVIALPSGLQYEVLRAGDGPKPAEDDSVKVNYHGTLLNGTVFDSSNMRNEPIVVKANQVIKGWTEALPNMAVGSKWKLFVPPDLAYGDNISAANIPPGATLVFEVELLSIEPKTQGAEAPKSEH
jgi:FKBP-type peptidyl-prolyl cis-trans isomerase FklB